MPSRAEHLADLAFRLTGRIGKIGDRVYSSRVKTLDPETMLPAICLYGPKESSGEAPAAGSHLQFQPEFELAIEVRVTETDGFDTEAGEIVEQVKTLLFTDPDWLRRFKSPISWSVRQFLDHRGVEAFCGELMIIKATDGRPTEYRPKAPDLLSIKISTDVDHDGQAETTTILSR